jgi:signal transduction histidine kinase
MSESDTRGPLPVDTQAQRLAALLELGAQLSSARDVDELLETVMERLTELLDAEAATVYVHDPIARELWSRATRGGAVREVRVPDSVGIAGHVFRSGRSIVLADAYADPRFNPEVDRQSGFRTRSLLTAPLRLLGGEVLGVLQVLDRRPGRFTPSDRALAEGIASQVAAVLEHLRLNEAIARQRDELQARLSDLDALYQFEQVLADGVGQQDLAARVLDLAMARLGAGAGCVLLLDEDRDSLVYTAARGERSEGLAQTRMPVGRGIAGYVAASGEVVRVRRAEDSPHFDRSVSRQLGVSTGAVLCVPIRAGTRVLGALELLNKRGGFTTADERLAVVLAGQAGRALARWQSQEELDRKARLATIGQMLSGVLHDLRTPLTVIGGYAEMLATEEDPRVRAEMCDQILAQLRHVATMQEETLAFVRGERSVLVRKVLVHTFMRELSEQLRQEFAGTQVELKVSVGYTGTARFDESKVRRALFNLARNALDAMPEGGRFTLSVDREGDALVFRAKDNGPGIPPEIAARLFESFVTSGKKHGTGLGLALVRKVAQEHGGVVTCKTQVGKGTTFELRLPANVSA